MRYGEAPADLGLVKLDWHEFMHYLYLPVRMPTYGIRLPERLEFLRPVVIDAWADALNQNESAFAGAYIYVTARRGFASPGNPLNRPGWHCDDFGGEDLNYVWTDAYPTRFLVSDKALRISESEQQSMLDMAYHANNIEYACKCQSCAALRPKARIEEGPVGHLLRLTPYVIHDTPIIPAPGGMRSFLKISVSKHRYNLLGNSHNYLFDYDWPLTDRLNVRNQPTGNNKDYVAEALT